MPIAHQWGHSITYLVDCKHVCSNNMYLCTYTLYIWKRLWNGTNTAFSLYLGIYKHVFGDKHRDN